MEYRQNDWSILGFGCMRFPKKGGSVDMKETEREHQRQAGAGLCHCAWRELF